MTFLEIVNLSINNIKGNLLRAILTLMIIAIGIAALVGILTSIDTAIYSLSHNFSSLGANSFSIHPAWTETSVTVRGRKQYRSTPITFKEAMEFKEKFDFNGRVSISAPGRGGITAKYEESKTNPDLTLIGVDENDLFTHGDELAFGRHFNIKEIESADRKIVLGYYVAKTLFDNIEGALNKLIFVNSIKYRVIGILEEKGSSMNQNSDKKMLIPVTFYRTLFENDRTNYKIAISMNNPEQMDDLISSSIGIMRGSRRLKTVEPNDFEIRKSDGMIEDIKENTGKLRMAAVLIGLITLLGAAIGLMNIMLVSVTERTKEIGIIKAIGATRELIVKQFLIEAILICQFGGLIGVMLGVGIGFGVSYLFKSPFVIPWAWMILGMTMCTVVGLLSGIYPAIKASKLDPIEALRYE